MSRTFRRKNYELVNATSWDRQGRKIAGFYTQSVYKYYYHFSACLGSQRIFREPTQRELNEQYWYNHGESGNANARSPGRHYRHMRMRENRRINKEELLKFFNDPDYEVMCEANPRNCWWDWS